ncbi:dnaJ homolog subfamily B member 12 [Triticum aestivum]|nr:dnaJ homolog subfamily B member 12-like [Triticum aestivum]
MPPQTPASSPPINPPASQLSSTRTDNSATKKYSAFGSRTEEQRSENRSMATFATSTAAVMGSARPGRVAGPRRCVAAQASSTIAAVAVGRTHYEVLGVGSGASRGEIKAAYRRLAREVQPDAAVGGGDEGFIRLHAAYATLADPDERTRYDRDVACRAAGMMMRRAAVAGPAFWRRTWETDQCW